MNPEKVLLQDDDCHWYLVELNDKERFNDLLNKGEDGEDEFIESFDKCMVNGVHSIIIKDYRVA